MIYYVIIYVAVFLASIGQIFLKIGSGNSGLIFGMLRFNRWVLLGIMAMTMSIFFSVRGLSIVPLKDMAFILPTTYILVPFLSKIFLKEKIGKRTIIGTLILIVGVIIFNIPILQLY